MPSDFSKQLHIHFGHHSLPDLDIRDIENFTEFHTLLVSTLGSLYKEVDRLASENGDGDEEQRSALFEGRKEMLRELLAFAESLSVMTVNSSFNGEAGDVSENEDGYIEVSIDTPICPTINANQSGGLRGYRFFETGTYRELDDTDDSSTESEISEGETMAFGELLRMGIFSRMDDMGMGSNRERIYVSDDRLYEESTLELNMEERADRILKASLETIVSGSGGKILATYGEGSTCKSAAACLTNPNSSIDAGFFSESSPAPVADKDNEKGGSSRYTNGSITTSGDSPASAPNIRAKYVLMSSHQLIENDARRFEECEVVDYISDQEQGKAQDAHGNTVKSDPKEYFTDEDDYLFAGPIHGKGLYHGTFGQSGAAPASCTGSRSSTEREPLWISSSRPIINRSSEAPAPGHGPISGELYKNSPASPANSPIMNSTQGDFTPSEAVRPAGLTVGKGTASVSLTEVPVSSSISSTSSPGSLKSDPEAEPDSAVGFSPISASGDETERQGDGSLEPKRVPSNCSGFTPPRLRPSGSVLSVYGQSVEEETPTTTPPPVIPYPVITTVVRKLDAIQTEPLAKFGNIHHTTSVSRVSVASVKIPSTDKSCSGPDAELLKSFQALSIADEVCHRRGLRSDRKST